MKIAYFTVENISQEGGVTKKIKNQINLWIEGGHQVKIFSVSPSAQIWNQLKSIDMQIICQKTILDIFWGMERISKEIINWEPDIVYLRHWVYYPYMKKIMNTVPTVVEINTNDVIEYKKHLNLAKYFYHLMTRNFIFNNVAGIIAVTYEIANLFQQYKKPTIVLGNGINLSEYSQIVPKNKINNSQPSLLFIGSPGYSWHGVDKIEILAKHFPQWNFHIVGYDLSYFAHPIPENIKIHGYLERKLYDNLIKEADIGISSLAFHRIGITEASPLKVREYLAYGLPIIISHKDTDFLDGASYILEISNCPNNVTECIDSIQKFVEKWKGFRIDRREILHLDHRIKEQQRLDFFEKLLTAKFSE